jgi:hypothetical protein
MVRTCAHSDRKIRMNIITELYTAISPAAVMMATTAAQNMMPLSTKAENAIPAAPKIRDETDESPIYVSKQRVCPTCAVSGVAPNGGLLTGSTARGGSVSRHPVISMLCYVLDK